MPTLITGSLAYDTIMVFPGKFKEHILPEQVHILNVCFGVPELRREFGGCCGNIAYNLKLLGGDPVAMGAVGEDFAPYRAWLEKNGIGLSHIKTIRGAHTAQAFVTTDADNNQIIAFHPGALEHAHENKVGDAKGVTLGIVAPDGRDAMIQHAAQFAQAGIPFMFDPGQALAMFGADELNVFIEQASYVVVNDYESELLCEKTGATLEQTAARADALVVTRGAKGADIYRGGEHIHIGAVKISEAKDPTGCGDAFRAGLLHGIAAGLDWQTSGQIASLLGGIKIERHGTQNHRFTKDEFTARYHENFGGDFKL